MKFHTLRREQFIPRPIHEVFAFFADAHNLEEITPPWLGFRILSTSSETISEGTQIRYRLRLHGLPIHSITEIRRWNEPTRFVDVQRSGPYRMWHHTHLFEAHGDQTKMIDVVRYILPLGILGRIVHALKVKADVRRIFDYRYKRITELFASVNSADKKGPPLAGARKEEGKRLFS
jgi:ligand-binding SRPBCC domain-containing protein